VTTITLLGQDPQFDGETGVPTNTSARALCAASWNKGDHAQEGEEAAKANIFRVPYAGERAPS
jgi:hypothetical protein